MKSSTSITEAKAGEVERKSAKGSRDSCFGDVSWVHRYLIISFEEIQRRENRGTVEKGGDVGDVGKSIVIRLGDVVEVSVVTTGTKGTIFLDDEVERRGPGTGSLLTYTHRFHFLKYSFSSSKTVWSEATILGVDR